MEGKEKRQLVLVDVNICFLGSEALLLKLQRLHFNFGRMLLSYGVIWSRKNRLNCNALFDSSACDVRSRRLWNGASLWTLGSY